MQLDTAIDTWKKMTSACQVIAGRRDGRRCDAKTVTSDPIVSQETDRIARSSNTSTDPAAVGALLNILNKFMTSLNTTFTATGSCHHRRTAIRCFNHE